VAPVKLGCVIHNVGRIYTVKHKNTPKFVDHNLIENGLQDFNNFSLQLFLTQLAIERLFKFLPHPTYASALPGKIKTHEIGVKINKKRQKPSVTLLILT